MKIAKEPISMETPMGEDGDSQLGDFIEDNTTLAPLDAALHASMRNVIKEVLDSLTPREAKCCACVTAWKCRTTTRWKKWASSST
jgi:RNA polymerase primary sigma factor